MKHLDGILSIFGRDIKITTGHYARTKEKKKIHEAFRKMSHFKSKA